MSWRKSSDNKLMEWVGGKFRFIVFMNHEYEACFALSLTDDAKKEMRDFVSEDGRLEEMASEATALMRDMMVEMVELLNVEIMKEVMKA